MRASSAESIDAEQARTFLAERLGLPCQGVEPIGAGAWSRCFAFRSGDEQLVIRFGRHVDDFRKDQYATRFHAPGLPIPRVHDIGEAFDGYCAISDRVYGDDLEQLPREQWRAVVPSVAAMLEALRTADVSATTGYGGWGANGDAPYVAWSSYLLAVADDAPDARSHGWRAKLASHLDGNASFEWGYARLQELALDAAPRTLIHGDLMNRNVLAGQSAITGVFDWGCACYGDHLYDLAWFDFWAPWHPNLDVDALHIELEQRWRAAGYTPANRTARLHACYLHIGLDHLAYNAWLEDWPTLAATAARMRVLVQDA